MMGAQRPTSTLGIQTREACGGFLEEAALKSTSKATELGQYGFEVQSQCLVSHVLVSSAQSNAKLLSRICLSDLCPLNHNAPATWDPSFCSLKNFKCFPALSSAPGWLVLKSSLKRQLPREASAEPQANFRPPLRPSHHNICKLQ